MEAPPAVLVAAAAFRVGAAAVLRVEDAAVGVKAVIFQLEDAVFGVEPTAFRAEDAARRPVKAIFQTGYPTSFGR